MTDFNGVRAKIERAHCQVEALNADMNGFCEKLKQSIVHEVDKDAGEQSWVYRGVTPDYPIEWSVRIGEVLYNLRSALDHIVWQLVLANGQEPGRDNEFPIVGDEANWLNAKKKLRGVGQDAESRIYQLQPFAGGLDPVFDVWIFLTLQCLCNMDKHRHLNLCALYSSGPQPFVFGGNQPPRRTSIPGRPLRGSATLGKIATGAIMLSVNDSEQELDPDFRIEIRFDYPPNPELVADPIPVILNNCLRAVREAYMRLRSGP